MTRKTLSTFFFETEDAQGVTNFKGMTKSVKEVGPQLNVLGNIIKISLYFLLKHIFSHIIVQYN